MDDKEEQRVNSMIIEDKLENSENFNMFYKDKEWGIKADSMLKLGDMEIYYSKEDEIIYVDDLSLQCDKNKKDYDLLSKSSLEELLIYLDWTDYTIGIFYYSFDESILAIKKIK